MQYLRKQKRNSLDVHWANDKKDDMLILEIKCIVSGRYIANPFKFILCTYSHCMDPLSMIASPFKYILCKYYDRMRQKDREEITYMIRCRHAACLLI
jgi:hypothetical protein